MKQLIQVVNEFMATSPDSMKDARNRLASLTKSALFASKKYKGFNFNYWLKQGCDEWRAAGEPGFPEKDRFIYGPSGDDSRITFYL